MSEYHMNINGSIQLGDYSSIYDYMAIVNTNDNLTIIIDNDGSENVNILCKMLEGSDFVVDLYKKGVDGSYHIKAYRGNS